MALFREHIAVGSLVAMVGVVLAYHYAYATDWRLLAVLFLVTVVASFLPDADSDTSVPFYLVYGLCTVSVVGFVLYYTIQSGTDNPYELFGRPFVAFLLMWFVAGGIVRRLTAHRGMFHSIPAVCITALSVLLAVRALGHDDATAFLLAVGAGLGYLTHLLLDEVHASVSIEGHLFRPRRSLGTALKFFTHSRVSTICTYVILAVLVYGVVYL